jgi:hypothetical protein
VVWDQTAFLPTIYLQLPRTPLPILWFRLWLSFRKLNIDHLLAAQSSLIVGIVISVVPLDQQLRSISSPLDHTLLYLHDLLTRGPFKSMVAIRFVTLGFADFNYKPSRSPRALLFEFCDLLMCGSHRLMTTNHLGYSGFRNFNSYTLTFPRSNFNWTLRSVNACLRQTDNKKFLQFFTWSPQILVTCLPQIKNYSLL